MVSFLETSGEIYTEGVRRVCVATKDVRSNGASWETEIDESITTDPHWIRFDIEPEAIPGLIEVLQRRYNDSGI